MEEFREACGPADPEVAKALYPDSLRALLGVEQVFLAVRVLLSMVVDIVSAMFAGIYYMQVFHLRNSKSGNPARSIIGLALDRPLRSLWFCSLKTFVYNFLNK